MMAGSSEIVRKNKRAVWLAARAHDQKVKEFVRHRDAEKARSGVKVGQILRNIHKKYEKQLQIANETIKKKNRQHEEFVRAQEKRIKEAYENRGKGRTMMNRRPRV